jgi:23S rRNA (uracil1939-C5)-methyltransferase
VHELKKGKETVGLQAGDGVETRIESVAFGGAGVARVQGMVVFVPYTVTNDEAEVEIVEIRKKFAIGKIKRITIPSEYRTEPLCPYFGRCGGCQIQHISYNHQLEIKQRQVRELFERLGKFVSLPLLDIIPSPRRFNYRGKADYHVRSEGGKVLGVGFMHATDGQVVDIERCEIVEESINRSYALFRETLFHGGGDLHSERQTIWSSSDGEDLPEVRDGAHVTSFVTRSVKDRCLVVPTGGFFQINASLVSALVDQVLSFAALSGSETVVDGYCGVGLFSLFMAPFARSIAGIEIHSESISCAQHNLKEAGLLNAVFFSGEIGSILKHRFVKRGMTADVVVLDPPRNGCSRDVLDAIKKIKAKKIIYISCNPSTQVRDIRYLTDGGFSLQCLQPLDMFPQTGHIEVIALLEG